MKSTLSCICPKCRNTLQVPLKSGRSRDTLTSCSCGGTCSARRLIEIQLLADIKDGKTEALEHMVTVFYDELYNRAYNVLRSSREPKEDAKDAVSEVITEVSCNGIGEINESLGSYLLGMIYYKAVNVYRSNSGYSKKKGHRVEYLEENHPAMSDESEGASSTENMIDVRTIMELIPPSYRIVLELQGAGYNENEIAEIIHRKTGTVKSRLNRARNMIKQLTQQERKRFQ